jgi:hypothetical protein
MFPGFGFALWPFAFLDLCHLVQVIRVVNGMVAVEHLSVDLVVIGFATFGLAVTFSAGTPVFGLLNRELGFEGSFRGSACLDFFEFDLGNGGRAGDAGFFLDAHVAGGDLEGVEHESGALGGNAVIDDGLEDLHDTDLDVLVGLEGGYLDAGIVVGSDGAAEFNAALLALLPAIVEITNGLLAKSGRVALLAIGLDVRAGTERHRHLNRKIGKGKIGKSERQNG